MPVLMFSAEAWCCNASLLSKLESFQSEIGKKIFRLPKLTANQVSVGSELAFNEMLLSVLNYNFFIKFTQVSKVL